MYQMHSVCKTNSSISSATLEYYIYINITGVDNLPERDVNDYNCINKEGEFRVHLKKDLFNRSNLLGIIDQSTSHPGHPLLTWEVKVEIRLQVGVKQNENQTSF